MTKVYTVDVETSGLDPYPHDVVFQVAISEIDVNRVTVTPIYNEILGYDTKSDFWKDKWNEAYIFGISDLSLEDIEIAYKECNFPQKIGKEVFDILKEQKIAIYNVGFDYANYLRYDPFNITRKHAYVLRCLMLAATDPCGIELEWDNYQNKWPKLHESVDILLDDHIQKKLGNNFHDASFDAQASGYILLELIKNYNYKV